MTAENNEMKNKNQEMDEHQKLTLDIFEYYTKSDFEGIEAIMDKITPKVKEEVIQYLNRFITYVNGWSDDDPSKKGKLLNFRIVKEIIQKYPEKKLTEEELKVLKEQGLEYLEEQCKRHIEDGSITTELG
tara:strand:+ start:187 stop:576 length:390 start_codon:yes stop_codon:yes gene_type:complete